jgi:predicted phosphodiesterase
MRILALSDLHLEFSGLSLNPLPEVDVVCLAGDVHVGVNGVGWAAEVFPDTPVVYVPGNHEYFRHTYPQELKKMHKLADKCSSVFVLDNHGVEVDGVAFLGCTLWTDFALLDDQDAAMEEGGRQMLDYQLIRVGPDHGRLTPRHTLTLHNASRRWLSEHFPVEQPTVVVTHHAPSGRSYGPGIPQTPLAAAFASALDSLVERSGAALWVHGHLHRAGDYTLGATRVLCNPRGYPNEPTGFRPDLVVDLDV